MSKTSSGQPHPKRTSSAKKKPASLSADLVVANRKLRRESADRKRADEQLRLLSKAIEQSQSTVVITDPNGNIEYVNPKFVQLTGYSVEEALGQNPRIVKSGETSPEEYTRLWATITAGQTWHGILHNKKKSGELYWEETNISPVFDADGKITHFVAVKEDITERKQAEQTLRESEERIRSILDTTVSGIITINERGTVESINCSASSMFGYAEIEVIGQNIKLLMPNPYHTEHDGYIDNYLRTGTKKIIGIGREVTGLRKNGTTFPLSLAVSEVRVGDLHLFTGIVQDITDSKQAEQLVEREKQKYEELFNTAQRQTQEMALLNEVQTALAREVDLSDLIRTVVEAIAKAFGYTQVSVYLRQNDVLHMHYQVGYEHPLLEISMTQGVMARSVRTSSVIFLPDVRSDPDFIGASVGINSEICVPLFDQQQAVGVLNVESTIGNLLTEADVRLISVLGQQVNIALGRARLVGELRRQAEELHARNTDLDTFAHTVAHDLKSPIGAIIGFS
ncbi:MAG TPA: PAS domain S-box protein, partial [Anaerolineae bacterium]|nr:PAS domain S-box protein [Anaerolineae bacterium]